MNEDMSTLPDFDIPEYCDFDIYDYCDFDFHTFSQLLQFNIDNLTFIPTFDITFNINFNSNFNINLNTYADSLYKNHYYAKIQRINEYCEFLTLNQTRPRIKSLDANERRLAIWRKCMNVDVKGQTHMNDNQKKELLSADPEFYKDHKSAKIQQINKYCDFFQLHQRQPKRKNRKIKKIDQTIDQTIENKLSLWRYSMLLAAAGKSNNVPLNTEQRIRVLSVDPGFFQPGSTDNTKFVINLD